MTSHLLEATPGDQTRHLVTGHLAVDGGNDFNIETIRKGEIQTNLYTTTVELQANIFDHCHLSYWFDYNAFNNKLLMLIKYKFDTSNNCLHFHLYNRSTRLKPQRSAASL